MNVGAFIPLIATIAYIPLLVILLSNRPWQRKHSLFLLFLIPAMLWSFSEFLFCSDWLMLHKLIAIKIVICMSIWMLIQLRYFIFSFYQTERIKIYVAYIFLIATLVLAALGYIPQGIEVTAAGIDINYGPWFIVIFLLFLATFGVKDGYYLIQKHRLSSNPVERNQIVYLFVAIGILIVSFLADILPHGGEFPFSHIGNLILACVLTYAVVTHRLLDIRVIFRRAFIYLAFYGGSVGILLLFLWLVQQLISFEFNFTTLAITISLGMPIILFFIHKVMALWQKKVE